MGKSPEIWGYTLFRSKKEELMLLLLIFWTILYFLYVSLSYWSSTGVKAPNLNILLPVEKAQIQTSAGQTEINMAGRWEDTIS